MAEFIGLSELASRPGLHARPVAVLEGRPVDRGAFVKAVGRWQATFEAMPGSRVGLYLDDPLGFAAALYGAWHARKSVHVPGDALPATLERLRHAVDLFAGDLPGGVRAAESANDTPRLPLDLRRSRLVLFTSGSSGEPVAIDKSLSQLEAEVRMQHAHFGRAWAGSGNLVVHTTVSHHHIYGLLFNLLWPLAAGCRFSCARVASADAALEQLSQAPSVLVSSPAFLKRLPLRAGRGTGVRAVLSSGGPLPADAAQQATRFFGTTPIEIFGSSETGGIAWRQQTAGGEPWTALPDVDWRIEDDGLLQVRSPYLPDEQWWLTTDLAEKSNDGFLLLGRADRVVKIEDKRVSLSAIERALLAVPLVLEARALPVQVGGAQRVGVVYVPSDAGRALSIAEGQGALHRRLREAIESQVDPIALPRRWRPVSAMPVNAQGKTPQTRLQALFDDTMPVVDWQRRDETEAVGRITPSLDLPAFDGHFPGVPILPGVVQLQWAVHCGRTCFGPSAAVRRLEALKFQKVVRPGTALTLSLRWAADHHTLHFRYESDDGTHASGRVVFKV